MSFLEELKRKKSSLKASETCYTNTSGEKFLMTKNAAGGFEVKKLNEISAGFVVDEKADLQVAEVSSYLYLSSQDPVWDFSLLKSLGITHVLSVGVEILQKFDDFTYKYVELLDLPESTLSKIFDGCFSFIDEAREKNGKVLVHCNAGYSRSPSVVIGYLMKKNKMTLDEALNKVREKRNVKPNEGFMKQLKEFEKLIFSL